MQLPGFINSFGIISFADPRPLTPMESYRFEKGGGEGHIGGREYSQPAGVPHPAKSLPFNLFADPHPLDLYPAIFYKKDEGPGSTSGSFLYIQRLPLLLPSIHL